MSNVKKLAAETIVYGASTVLGKLLNWLLLPLYVRTLSVENNGYITYLYSIIGIAQVLLTFGFETGFFRFVSKNTVKTVFTTLFSFLLFASFIFLTFSFFYKDDLAIKLGIVGKENIVFIIAILLVFDSIISIPFALLRYFEKSLKYSLLRFLQVIVTCFFNILFLVYFPQLDIEWIQKFTIDNDLRNVFIANLIGSLFAFIFLIKLIFNSIDKISFTLFKRVFTYSYPIWIVGIFGMFNLNGDKILLQKFLNSDNEMEVVGIYGANFKLGVLMAIFTQSFRLAFEPFFFKNRDLGNVLNTYSSILNYFVAFGMLIFLGVLLYLPIINIVLVKEYFEGNKIIPFVLLGQLFFGIYYSLSLWYKLLDKTFFGIIFTVIGSIVGILGFYFLIPLFGYIGAAIAGFISYFVMALFSFYIGQKYYRVPYDEKRIITYILLGIILYLISLVYSHLNTILVLSLNTFLFIFYAFFIIKKENLLSFILNRNER
ncbi:MAG: oligosaccharide flippase family protein [Marinilabiliaceae bacterium]|nr:oligosaccharide flippase family protein [Marinilabiliaceae bacterium]